MFRLKSYAFTDNITTIGLSYYRLKIIDRDGRYNYSRIVKIEAGKAVNISIAPNPAHHYFVLTGAEVFTNIFITDASGRLVRQMKRQSNNRYDIAGFTKGVYLIQLKNDNQILAEKLVIE